MTALAGGWQIRGKLLSTATKQYIPCSREKVGKLVYGIGVSNRLPTTAVVRGVSPKLQWTNQGQEQALRSARVGGGAVRANKLPLRASSAMNWWMNGSWWVRWVSL